MSTRAIAPIVGVSPRQPAYDRRASEGVQSVHTSDPEPGLIVDHDTGEILDAPAPGCALRPPVRVIYVTPA